jgi:hypothetical protein
MVYVWHCDKDGYYSGYNQNGADMRGQTFCRGAQATDTSGRVTFNTIYNSVTNAVYASPLYAAKGPNPTTPTSDGIFSDGVAYQMPTVTPNATTGGYDAELAVGIGA